MPPLILASTSRYRHELLTRLRLGLARSKLSARRRRGLDREEGQIDAVPGEGLGRTGNEEHIRSRGRAQDEERK